MSDPTRLRQILMNLVGNGTKFTDSGGVTITAEIVERDGTSRLIIDVEDTGPGMSEEQKARLFNAFSQADDTTTRKYGGTGLGLNISRRLANLMGGDVKLERSEPGKGSCFRVELPLELAPGTGILGQLEGMSAPTGAGSTTNAMRLCGRILLAEDGVDNQRLISFHLKKAGAEVLIAENGRIALEMLDRAAAEGRPFDLLISDMQMPEIDGYELARTLRRRGSTLPIVALTAHAMSEDRFKCLDAGCNDYASKPIDRAALLATCAKWIGRAVDATDRSIAA